MKVYLLHGNTCEQYGYEAHVFGIFNTREKAEKAAEKVMDRYLHNGVSLTSYDMDIVEFELNKDTDVFLGGYEE